MEVRPLLSGSARRFTATRNSSGARRRHHSKSDMAAVSPALRASDPRRSPLVTAPATSTASTTAVSVAVRTVLGPRAGEREPRVHLVAAVRAGPVPEHAAAGLHPLTHADQAMPGPGGTAL